VIPSLAQNHPKRSVILSKVNSEVRERSEQQSNTLSEASKMPLKPLSNTKQYNLSSNQNEPQNRPKFITLGNISEQEKIEIIQKGFQLQSEGRISLKKYYEGTETHSLFQSKGYSIKYETIRRTKLYQTLKA
jgi:hypothetical protein